MGFDYIRNPIGASNENEIDARRHLSGTEVLAEWNETSAERLATLRSADEAYLYALPTSPRLAKYSKSCALTEAPIFEFQRWALHCVPGDEGRRK